ncbi:MAG: Hpt domain-containing protein [Thioalkalispiraceae bacterium]|jgi:two-component system sensor histidine kinase BarA
MTKVIDYQLALEQSEGSEELAKELFSMLLTELPGLQQKLNLAVKENDLQACWDHAHKIYGSTSYCGVPALREAAQIMEEAVKDADLGKVEENFTALSAEIERLLEQGQPALADSWTK